MPTNKEIQQKRAEANTLDATFHLGKDGVTDAAVAELTAQLRKRKLVKARLLAAATEGGSADKAQAEALAQATDSVLVEVRGHTAVFWRR
jgi:RNA-binding protein